MRYLLRDRGIRQAFRLWYAGKYHNHGRHLYTFILPKGFYDRFLEKVFEKKTREKLIALVGFCYDFQIVESVFTEKNDIPVDFVISDEKVIQVFQKCRT